MKKRTPFLFCAILGLAGFARSAEPAKTALCWAPTSAADYDGFLALMTRHPNARLTVALAPEDVPEAAKARLIELAKEGRLELALRIAGDPILPLVRKYRPRDPSYRLAAAKELHRRLFGQAPMGFVPGGGALDAELADALRGQHLRWAAVAATTPWFQDDLALVPFQSLDSTASVPAAGALLIEDSAPGAGGLDILNKLLSDDDKRWTTVADTLPSSATATAAGAWPAGGGDYSSWQGDPLQQRAWSLYAAAADALSQFENSGRAGLSSLDKALSALYAAQASRFFRLKSLRTEADEREYRSLLQKVFRITAQAAPDDLARPMAQAGGGGAPGEDVRSGIADHELWFENPEGSLAEAPEPPPGLSAQALAQELWILKSLRVRWDDKAVTFAFAVGRVANLQAAPAGFSPLMLDLYIDLNHIAGQGATSLMPGRRGFVQPRDAWEYALVVTGWGAGMYRASGMEPALIQDLAPKVEDGWIKVSVPRSKLRGNPARWGYLALALGVSPESAQKNGPPLPLPGRSGNPVLGVLGPLESQQMTAGGAASYRRFAMLRLRGSR